MENVCHPLCACGQPVLVHEWKVPNYDDGGGLDSFDIEYEFDSDKPTAEDRYRRNQLWLAYHTNNSLLRSPRLPLL